MKLMKIYLIIGFCLMLGYLPVQAADQSICKDARTVSLYEDGSMQSCVLKDNYKVNGIECESGHAIKLYMSGNLESCVLYKDASIGTNKCQANGLIYFYQDGNLKQCAGQ